jgi:hypothetical protein
VAASQTAGGTLIASFARVMSTSSVASSKRPSLRPAAAGSWIALVAATTLGDAAGAVRAEVRANGLSAGQVYRLVVQSFERGTAQGPGRDARPIGSVQRAVTADELRHGVHVSLLEMRTPAAGDGAESKPVVMAWVEAGGADLEWDGRMARPRAGSVYGVAKRAPKSDTVQISLNRTCVA